MTGTILYMGPPPENMDLQDVVDLWCSLGLRGEPISDDINGELARLQGTRPAPIEAVEDQIDARVPEIKIAEVDNVEAGEASVVVEDDSDSSSSEDGTLPRTPAHSSPKPANRPKPQHRSGSLPHSVPEQRQNLTPPVAARHTELLAALEEGFSDDKELAVLDLFCSIPADQLQIYMRRHVEQKRMSGPDRTEEPSSGSANDGARA